MAERLLREGDARQGAATAAAVSPGRRARLLRAWLASVGLDDLSEADLVAYMQDERFTHADLYRRALPRARAAAARGGRQRARRRARRARLGGRARRAVRGLHRGDPLRAVGGVHRRERAEARTRAARTARRAPRVAIVADGIGAMHGVTRTIEEIRERGVAGFEIEVIGTDPNVDRRLPAVAEVEVPTTRACSSACRACRRPSRRSPTGATT